MTHTDEALRARIAELKAEVARLEQAVADLMFQRDAARRTVGQQQTEIQALTPRNVPARRIPAVVTVQTGGMT